MIHKKIFSSKEEWLNARENYIGGSDASAILGLNPWKSNLELFEEKTGIREAKQIDDIEYVAYGQKAEKYLRKLFELDFPKLQIYYEPNNMFTNDKYPFAHASLDGWLIDTDGRKGILEIKTTLSSNYLKWKDKVPDNYYIQLLWYMGIMEADFGIIKCQMRYADSSFTTRHYRFERKEAEEDIEYLFDEARKFWKCVEDGSKPSLKLPEI